MRGAPTFRRQNAEVYYTDGPFAAATADSVDLLKRLAADNPRKRCRLCFHADPSAPLHEMLIVHHRDAYVRPHWHVGKSESLAVVEGDALAVMFDEVGGVADVLPLAPYGRSGVHYYRMPEGMCHSLLIRSEWLVFQETTSGPFDPARTQFPTWAPDGGCEDDVDGYRAALFARVTDFVGDGVDERCPPLRAPRSNILP